MKKLFMFLAVAGLATFGASCSSSDDNGNGGGNDKETLTLSADKTSVKVDETVTFTVSEKDAEIYVEGKKISSKSTKFDKEGSYKVVAKKNGFNDSPVVTIKVAKDGTPGDGGDGEKKTLTLNIAPAEVTLGEAVTFIVMEGTANVTADAKIYVNGNLVSGSTYTATEVGEYTVVAKKEGANDSVEKTFTVVEVPVAPEGNFVMIGNDVYDIVNADMGVFTGADRVAIRYTGGEGAEAFTYCVFRLFGNLNEEGSDFNALTLAVIQDDANPEALVWPQDAAEGNIIPLNSYVAIGGQLAAETGDDEEFGVSLGFGVKPTEDALGQFAYGIEAEEFTAEYEGEYDGLWALVQQGARGVKAESQMSVYKTLSVKAKLK